MICPHCRNDFTGQPEFCPNCGRILPPVAARSPYEVLGYAKESLQMDRSDLEQKLFLLSKKFHPDRFAGKTPQEIQYSHDHASAVNNAYRILKDPFSRAKYFVERDLGSIEEKSAGVPPDMADLFFEVHDHLDAIQDSNGNPPDEAHRAVAAAEKDLKMKLGELEQQLYQRFAPYDENGSKKVIQEIKDILSHRSYILSFLRKIDNILGRDT